MDNKERTGRVANAANRYDLTALLEAVCHYDRPDNVRRKLTACYFAISRQIAATGEGAGEETGEMLATLSLIIEALDSTATTGEPPLTVAPDYKATRATLEAYAAEIEATKKEVRTAREKQGRWADIYHDLWQRAAATLPKEQKQKHKEFKARIIGQPLKHP